MPRVQFRPEGASPVKLTGKKRKQPRAAGGRFGTAIETTVTRSDVDETAEMVDTMQKLDRRLVETQETHKEEKKKHKQTKRELEKAKKELGKKEEDLVLALAVSKRREDELELEQAMHESTREHMKEFEASMKAMRDGLEEELKSAWGEMNVVLQRHSEEIERVRGEGKQQMEELEHELEQAWENQRELRLKLRLNGGQQARTTKELQKVKSASGRATAAQVQAEKQVHELHANPPRERICKFVGDVRCPKNLKRWLVKASSFFDANYGIEQRRASIRALYMQECADDAVCEPEATVGDSTFSNHIVRKLVTALNENAPRVSTVLAAYKREHTHVARLSCAHV